MDCRSSCGACCIAPSINKPFLGMPEGKPAGVRCVHLNDQMRCEIFTSPERPKICGDLKPEPWFCGETKEQALKIISDLEKQTS